MGFLFALIGFVVRELFGRVIIPGIGINIWDFTIFLACASIVISVLITSVRSGSMSAFGRSGKGKNNGNN